MRGPTVSTSQGFPGGGDLQERQRAELQGEKCKQAGPSSLISRSRSCWLLACRAGCHGWEWRKQTSADLGSCSCKRRPSRELVSQKERVAMNHFQALLAETTAVTGNEGLGPPPEMRGRRGHLEGLRPAVWAVSVPWGQQGKAGGGSSPPGGDCRLCSSVRGAGPSETREPWMPSACVSCPRCHGCALRPAGRVRNHHRPSSGVVGTEGWQWGQEPPWVRN